VGAAYAFLFYRYRWDLARLWSFRMPARPRVSKPRLRVHNPEDRYRELDQRADRILDKVHREGEDSITAEERRILEDYSRRMRQKHR
jgi:hypothetical protein